MTEERLQKFLARAGVASRRACEAMVAEGRVAVNGAVASVPGIKVDPSRDTVTLDGKRVRLAGRLRYVLLHKTRGVTTTAKDDLGRRAVLDLLPPELLKDRLFPVGRLDKDSEGLIVLTNDGEMANRLTHPAYGVTKTYRATLEGRIELDVLARLASEGIRLGPVVIRPRKVEWIRYESESTIVLVTVAEGVNREIRRIFAALGHEVKRLVRLEIGPLTLKGLGRGAWRELSLAEAARLQRFLQTPGTPDAVGAEYGPGTAASRRPTGPRGRGKPRPPRAAPTGGERFARPKAPRLGKPDPALHAKTGRPNAARPSISASSAPPAPPASRGLRDPRAKTAKPAAKPFRPGAAPAGGKRFARPGAPRLGKPDPAIHAKTARPGAPRLGKPDPALHVKTGRPGALRLGKPDPALHAKTGRSSATRHNVPAPSAPSASRDLRDLRVKTAKPAAKPPRHPLAKSNHSKFPF